MPTYVAIDMDVSALVGAEWNDKIEMALIRSINKTADRARTRAARSVLEQVAFPSSYVAPAARRITVARKATKNDPFEAIVTGRDRATSLARFTKQKPLGPGKRPRGGEISLTVKPGRRTSIQRAFLITLNNSNVGLAVRTEGPAPANAYKPKPLGKNLWLLYGPSVDQALSAASDGKGVYEEMSPELLDFLETEFNRQLDVLNAV